VDVGAFDGEDEAVRVLVQHLEGRVQHLVEQRLVGGVVGVDDVRGAAAAGDLVEGHVHVAVAEQAEQLRGVVGHGQQLRRGRGVVEAGGLEVGQQVAARVDGAGGHAVGAGQLGRKHVVRAGRAARAELARGQEPAPASAHQHGQAAAGALVEVLIADAGARIAVRSVDRVGGGGGVFDVGGGGAARGVALGGGEVDGRRFG